MSTYTRGRQLNAPLTRRDLTIDPPLKALRDPQDDPSPEGDRPYGTFPVTDRWQCGSCDRPVSPGVTTCSECWDGPF